MVQRETPPSSPHMEDELEEDDLVYVGDVDEVIESLEEEDNDDVEDGMDDEHPIQDDATCVFTKHQGSVFCGSLNQDGTLAVTGGEDDKAFVWDTASGHVVFECTGHEDSVIFADFNQDGSYLATADMNGVVQVWKMSSKLKVWEYNMGDMTWMRWHTAANVLFGGSVNGEIYMWKIPSGDCKILQGHGQRTDAGVIMPDGKRLAVGYADGAIKIFDLKSGTVAVTISSDSSHESSITALDCHPDNNLLISAAVDGKTILATSQSGKVIAILQDLKETKASTSTTAAGSNDEVEDSKDETTENWVEAVTFCKDAGFDLAATGTLNGDLVIWDTSKQVPRHVVKQESGISKLVWLQTTSLVFSSGLDGIVRCFDARSGQFIRSVTGHFADILDLSISRDGKIMLTTSDDTTARIFNVNQPNKQ